MNLPRHTVIVAEDQPLLRMLAVDELQAAGFDVVEAAHADEALAHIDRLNGEVHLLFTDVQMPLGSYNGLELARRVRSRWPHVAILVTSATYTVRPDELPEGGHFLVKPYETAKIGDHVRRLIAT